MTGLASDEGKAKPMPMLPPEGEKIAVLMPTTLPSMSNIGPPELPRLMAASVWMKSSYGPELMSRWRAETMPAVTLPPRPKGLPMAITQSPILALSLSPHSTKGNGVGESIFSSARSVLGSWPISFALYSVLSWVRTVISSAPSMTWLLVTI